MNHLLDIRARRLPVTNASVTAARPGKLVKALTQESGVAVARTPDGLQPLCAVWRVNELNRVADALAQGSHPPIHVLLAEMAAVELPFEAEGFVNVNTEDDYVAARSRHER
jgi:molybdopterin-guanine dinucleotide biosynthesis protein A